MCWVGTLSHITTSPSATISIEDPLRRLALCAIGIYRGSRNIGYFTGDQGPFPPPALPGLSSTTGPSAICPGRLGPSRGRRCRPDAGRSAPGQTSLVAFRFSPHVLSPLPRWDRRVRISLTSPATAAFPVKLAGRLPRRRFEACSAFTRVTARAVRCPPEEDVSSDASDHLSPPDPSEVLPVGARVTGWGSNPPNRNTLARHTTQPGRTALALLARTLPSNKYLIDISS